MTEQHPIVPPQEIVQEWISRWLDGDISEPYPEWFAARSAQWGFDRASQACIDWVFIHHGLEQTEQLMEHLRAARRPKPPPSLKEQALKLLAKNDDGSIMLGTPMYRLSESEAATIRLALEQLND